MHPSAKRVSKCGWTSQKARKASLVRIRGATCELLSVRTSSCPRSRWSPSCATWEVRTARYSAWRLDCLSTLLSFPVHAFALRVPSPRRFPIKRPARHEDIRFFPARCAPRVCVLHLQCSEGRLSTRSTRIVAHRSLAEGATPHIGR